MEDITFLSDDEKVQKLVADVKHKFSVFSVSNTLFPKNEISDTDLKIFFEKILNIETKNKGLIIIEAYYGLEEHIYLVDAELLKFKIPNSAKEYYEA
jgi:hypothetical protein